MNRCGRTVGYQDHFDNGTEPCQACRDAKALWQRRYRKRVYLARGPMLIDATGTRRRLQALVRIGHPFSALGKHLGVSGAAVNAWSLRPKVTRTTAATVAAMYDELWDVPGPSPKVAERAKTKGWVPPLGWNDDDLDNPDARPSRMVESRPMFDDIAIERAMRGSEVHLRPAERAEAVRRLTERGFSAAQIADRLRVTRRAVERIRGGDGAHAA